jgi:hypothetical protein
LSFALYHTLYKSIVLIGPMLQPEISKTLKILKIPEILETLETTEKEMNFLLMIYYSEESN